MLQLLLHCSSVYSSIFELYPLRHRQPVQNVAKNWRDLLAFAKTDKTCNGVEYHLQSAVIGADVPYSTALQLSTRLATNAVTRVSADGAERRWLRNAGYFAAADVAKAATDNVGQSHAKG